MKKLRNLLLMLLSLIVMTYTGCKMDNNDDDNDDVNVPVLSDDEIAAIEQSYADVSATVDGLLLSDDPVQEFQDNLSAVIAFENVEDAWIAEDALVVKFEKGGKAIWYASHDYIIPPYGEADIDNLFKEFTERIPVGDTTALLLNQQAGDENRPYCGQIINHLKTKFEANKYKVTVVNGSSVNLGFMASGFAGYGAYFFISHGIFDGTRTWVMTGEEPNTSDPLGKLLRDLYAKWFKEEICIGGCREKRNGNWETVNFYLFSDKYVSGMYPANSFPNSLIYLVACQGMKNLNLAQAYVAAGAGVVIGWDETNCLGQATGKLLFDLLLGGMTVEEAFAAIPVDSKVDKCEVAAGAKLTYYPASGKDIVLVMPKEAEIIITTPVAGETYADRLQQLTGYMSNVVAITNGVVELNGVATTLEVQNDTNFSQPLLINNGTNTIKVTCIGKNDKDETVTKTKEITVIGELAPIDIFTELRWNTPASDVDFHLLKPGAGIGDLWTSSDCYYQNMNTSWGAFLDVDDVEGYGPEHITVPAAQEEGDYTLCIHYYDEDGQGTTQAFVSVSVQNGEMQSFGPFTLSNDGTNGSGDVWEVCTINFPTGVITPLNTYHNLGKSKSNQFLPKK